MKNDDRPCEVCGKSRDLGIGLSAHGHQVSQGHKYYPLYSDKEREWLEEGLELIAEYKRSKARD